VVAKDVTDVLTKAFDARRNSCAIHIQLEQSVPERGSNRGFSGFLVFRNVGDKVTMRKRFHGEDSDGLVLGRSSMRVLQVRQGGR
jgi:hypothetical protein